MKTHKPLKMRSELQPVLSEADHNAALVASMLEKAERDGLEWLCDKIGRATDNTPRICCEPLCQSKVEFRITLNAGTVREEKFYTCATHKHQFDESEIDHITLGVRVEKV